MKLRTVRNFATDKGKTTQWAYDLIKKNKVKVKEIDGVKFIIVND
jgi:hypothetical protein